MVLEYKQNGGKVHFPYNEYVVEISFLRQILKVMHKVPDISQFESTIILHFFLQSQPINLLVPISGVKFLYVFVDIPGYNYEESEVKYGYKQTYKRIHHVF